MNYQPASWDGSDVRDDSANRTAYDATTRGATPYYGGDRDYDRGHDGRPIQTTMSDQYGRQYRCHCVPIQRPRPRPQNDLNQIARAIIGRHLNEARRIYPNIREVIRDGQHLVVTQDFRRDRINVETRNGVINRIAGFY